MVPLIPAKVRRAAARVRWLSSVYLRPYRPDAVRFERVLGADFLILPGVMNPVIFRTGLVLAEAVASAVDHGDPVLDMGCGSGIVGVLAARRGATVYSVDQNPDAVRATRVNAMLNGVELRALAGDLFATLNPSLRFRVVAFNPPFFLGRGDPALYGGDQLEVIDRFLAQARDRLLDKGRILLAGSTTGALEQMRALYTRHGFSSRTIARQERISERITIDCLT